MPLFSGKFRTICPRFRCSHVPPPIRIPHFRWIVKSIVMKIIRLIRKLPEILLIAPKSCFFGKIGWLILEFPNKSIIRWSGRLNSSSPRYPMSMSWIKSKRQSKRSVNWRITRSVTLAANGSQARGWKSGTTLPFRSVANTVA